MIHISDRPLNDRQIRLLEPTVDRIVNRLVFHTNTYVDKEEFGTRVICLDSCAGESIFNSRELFEDITITDSPLVVRGVNVDSKPMRVKHEGNTIFGIVYYSKDCVANVLSLGNAIDYCYEVKYVGTDDEFRVRVTEKGDIYIFHRDINTNTYVCNLDTDVTTNKHVHRTILVSSVIENKKKYSHREIKAAALARTYQNNLGPCSEGQLIKLISRGKLDNNKIVAQDVIRALDIWGPSLANVKGKTVSHKAELQEEIVTLSNQIKADQTMFVDLMFVNGVSYLISVFKPLEYVAVTKIAKKDINTLLNTTISHMNIVRKHGHKVPLCRIDGESAMSSEWFVSKISAEGTILDTTGAGEAVSVVERKIRHTKNLMRGIINTLPYRLTEQLESWLIRYVVSRINIVPTRNNFDYVSPREKLWGRRINVDKELKHGFGDYVQVHVSTVDNSMVERTSGALAMMPSGNLEGSWYYYQLLNNEIIKRNKATVMPITDEIIAYINDKSISRKGKMHTLAIPHFERGFNHTYIEDDVDDLDTIGPDQSIVTHNDVPVIQHHIDEDEYPYDIGTDSSAEQVPALEDLLEDTDLEYIQEKNIRGDNQALLDSIFGTDQELDEETLEEELTETNIDYNNVLENVRNVQDVQTNNTEVTSAVVPSNLHNIFTPRRSSRNHVLDRWKKKIVGITTVTDPELVRDSQYKEYNMSRHSVTKRTFSLNMTISQGIRKLGYAAIDSIVKEMIQLSDLDVLEGMRIEDLSTEQRSRIISSSMFLKEKYTADGIFEKVKARLVAGGHLQDRDIYTDGSSPTLSTSSLFILSSIASRGKSVAAIDFPGAFLNSVMPDTGDHVVIMRLNKFLTSVLVKIDQNYSMYVQKNGTCVVRLKRALYGCVESAAMWYKKLSHDLILLGYAPNKLDMCIFNRLEKDHSQTTLLLHVDDMKIMSDSESIIDHVIDEIELIYPGLTKQRGRIINYLGMTFDYSVSGKVKITMENYVREVLKGCEDIEGTSDSPAHSNLFSVLPVSTSALLGDKDKERFHSVVAQLLYLSKRVRPDLLVAVSFLTKRVLCPQQDDWTKLKRAIQYLRKTNNLGMVLEGSDTIGILAFVDASYGVHSDMKSHSGCVIGIGRGPVYAKSGGQKLNTKSSTEAELIALSDSATQIIWTRNFLLEQGYSLGPAIVYQDNLSKVALVKNGKSNSERTRHIAIRYFFISDRVASKEISIEYMPTGEMLADILTKPLQGALFIRLRDKLLNWY